RLNRRELRTERQDPYQFSVGYPLGGSWSIVLREELLKNICVIGTGYVGLVTGVCFADLGNTVVCVDIDPHKLELLRAGQSPIYAPGLEEALERNISAGRLSFTDSYTVGLDGADFAFITVGTPMRDD